MTTLQASPLPCAATPTVIGSRKATVACALGNALEMYDFTIYSFFAVVIAKNFFPHSRPWHRY